MEESRIRLLRRRQIIYTNLLFLIYAGVVFGFILTGATTPIVYLILAVIFLISPISLLFRSPNLLLLLFPSMRELANYEKEKLGDQWLRYQLSFVLIQLGASIIFFIQTAIRPHVVFMDGIPIWYFIVIPLILLILANSSERSHARRIDNHNYEELKSYTADRILLTTIFTSIAMVVMVVVIIIYQVMESSWSQLGPY